MRRIFISYRRKSSLMDAAMLFDRLSRAFGAGNVFMDIAGIPPGESFDTYLLKEIDRCDDFLLMVGEGTFDRIHDPEDWVRQEIAHALKRSDIRVIPILVDNPSLPKAHELPDDIREIVFKSGIPLARIVFEGSVNTIIDYLKKGKPSAFPESNLETARFIQGRDAVIDRAISMIEETQRTLNGQGDDLDWIRTRGEIGERFKNSYEAMLLRLARVQLISSGNGPYALETARILTGYSKAQDQVQVLFKKYGHVRVLVSDNKRILLAFRRGDNDYFGLYLENEDLANWLELRQRRLVGEEDVIPADDKINMLLEYAYELKQYEFLTSEAYFKRLIELIANARSTIRLAGHYATAILRDDALGEEFRTALRMAIEENRVHTVKILVAKQDDVARKVSDAYEAFRETLDEAVNTRQKDTFMCPRCLEDYGQVRHVIIDDKHFILGLPHAQSTKKRDPQSQTYLGLATTNSKMARWLVQRFDDLWERATPLKP